MSLRMPQNLSTSTRFETGLSVLEAALRAEQASSLGRLGREVETSLAALAQAPAGAPDRASLVQLAADAVWRFFVQRDCCGLNDQVTVIAHYQISPEVLVRVGAGSEPTT